LVLWLELRFYPAVLLFYAFGLGVLKAGNYGGLYRWLTQSVYRDHQDDLPFIQRYGYWLSEMAQHWKMLEGLERHKTPLSDHLHDVTQPLSLDIALAERDHTRLFELFETLTALAYLTVKASEEELTHTLASEGGRGFVWAPIGRAGWDNVTRNQILLTCRLRK